jgi:hypothetical protein
VSKHVTLSPTEAADRLAIRDAFVMNLAPNAGIGDVAEGGEIEFARSWAMR